MTRQKRKNLIIAAIVLLLATVIATVAVFAYFSVDFDVKNDVSSLEKIVVSTTISESSTNAMSFKQPGDTYSANLIVNNQSTVTLNDAKGASTTKTVPVTYRVKVGGLAGDATLKDAIIVKIDGKVIGMLSQLLNDDGELQLENDFILAANSQRTHKIELELHAGAGRRFENTTNHITITVAAQTFVNQNYLFVRSSDEFLQAIYTANQSKGGKTIYLVNSFEFGAAVAGVGIALTQPTNIDLNGNTLTLRAPLTFAKGGALLSTLGTAEVAANDITEGGVVASTGIVVVNSTEGYLKTAKEVTVSAALRVDAFDKAAMLADAARALTRETERGISNAGVLVLSDFKTYISKNVLTVTVPDNGLLSIEKDDINQTVSIKTKLTNLPTELFGMVNLSVLGQSLSVPVRVNSQQMNIDDLLNNVINENCSFLAGARVDGKTEAEQAAVTPYVVDRNLYLPDEVGAYSTTIQWVSSKISVLGHDGSYIPATADENIYLTAIISYQGTRYVREYLLKVKALPPDLRLKDICLIQPVTFSSVGEIKDLINENDYEEYKLKVVKYELKTEDTALFTLNGVDNQETPWTLTLIGTPPGDSLRTTIKVYAKFERSDQPGVYDEATCDMDVAVKIERRSSIYDEALRYINGHLQEIENNTFLSFRLPDAYGNQLTLTYEIVAGSFDVNGMQLKNPSDVANYIEILRHDTLNKVWWVDIKPNMVPRENTPIHVLVKMNAPGAPASEEVHRSVSFSLTGIIHFADDDVRDFSLYAKLLKVTDQSPDAGNNDGYITMDEARNANIPILDLNDTGLSDLKGIEYFPNITELRLSKNQIVDISYLSGLYNLKILDLSNNKITNIAALADILGLTVLNLSNNFVVDISSLTRLTRLQDLSLNGNKELADISAITNMKGLASLRAYDTKVQESFSANSSLNAVLTAYFQYEDAKGTTPKYYIANNNTVFSVANATDYRAKNTAINAIVPVYEFSNVLYLPSSINGNTVEWESPNGDIIQILNEGGKTYAYISQPISDVNISIVARIVLSGGNVLSRYFPVLSKGTSTDIEIYVGEGVGGANYKLASDIIPDSRLRYELVKLFNTDNDPLRITKAEIDAIGNVSVMLENKGIKSIEGIQYFPSIQSLDLSSNPFTDLSPLLALDKNGTQLDKLYLKYSNVDLTQLKDFTKPLSLLEVYGSPNTNHTEVLKALISVYDRQPTKDSIIRLVNPDTIWNPYADEVARAATTVTDSISLKAGEFSSELPTEIQWNFLGKTEPLTIRLTYSAQDNTILSLSANKVTVSYQNAPSIDTYAMITVSAKLIKARDENAVSLAKLVYVQASMDVMLQTGVDSDGDPIYTPLTEAVPDSSVRKQILNRCVLNGEAVISADTFKTKMNGAELVFICDTKEGIKGLELFTGINIPKITIFGLTDSNDPTKAKALAPLNAVAATLISLDLQFCNVDFTAITTPMANLTSLTIFNSVQIKFKSNDTNVFDMMPELTTLTAFDNSISDFSALSALKKAKTVIIYNNIGSLSRATDAALNAAFASYVGVAGDSAEYFYYVRKDEIWYPNSVGVPVVNGTDAKVDNQDNGKPLLVDVWQPNFVVGGTKLYLPLKFAAKYDISWSTAFTTAITIDTTASVEDANGNGYVTATVNAQNVDAYVSLQAYFPSFRKTLTYYVVIKGTGADAANYVSLGKFYQNATDPFESQKLADPYFTNLMYQELQAKSANNTTGVYLLSVANQIKSINWANTKDRKDYQISSVRGIENFLGLTSVVINYTTITNIAPIAALVNLVTLNLDGNNIYTLWLDNGDSVFKNLTKLTTLRVAYNKHVDDYTAVVYNTRNGKEVNTERLKKLTTLYLEQVEGDTVWGWVTQLRPDQNFNETVKVWFTANAGASVTLYLSNKDGSNNAINNATNVAAALEDLNELDLGELKDKYYLFAVDTTYILRAANDNTSPTVTLPTSYTAQNNAAREYAYQLVSWRAQADKWMQFSTQGTVSSLNTTKFKSGGEVQVLAVLPSKLKKQFVIDISNIINTVGTVVEVPRVEITAAELAIYQDFYRARNPILASQYRQNAAGNYEIFAESIIPDYEFRNQLFAAFDNGNQMISIAERNVVKAVSNSFNNSSVRSVLGMELFPNVTNWMFNVTRIHKIDAFPALEYSSTKQFSLTIKDEFTYDISGLLYFKDRINSLTLESYGAFPQSCAEVIAQLDLTSLKLIGTAIYDYSFLASLSDTLQTLDFNTPNNIHIRSTPYSKNSASYGNRDKMIQFLFDTPGKAVNVSQNLYAGIPIANGTASLLDGIAPNEDLISDYLNKINEVPKTPGTYTLDASFIAYGKTYGLRYEAVAGQGYTLSGNEITVTETAEDTFQIVVQVVNKDGKPTLKQTSTFAFGESSATGAQGVETEARFVHTDGIEYDLKEFVPDPALRYNIIKTFDRNKDGLITRQEFLSNSSMHIVGTASTWNPQVPWMAVTSLEGIGILSENLKTIVFNGFYTLDTAALAELTSLEKIALNGLGSTNPKYVVATDWKALRSLSNLNTIEINHGTWIRGIEVLADLVQFTTMTGVGVSNTATMATASEINAFAYMQAANNMSASSNTAIAMRSDQKMASLILASIDFGALTFDGSQLYFNNQAQGSTINMPSAVTYLSTAYKLSYVALSSNLSFLIDDTTSATSLKISDAINSRNTRVQFVVKIELNGAKYERRIEFEIDRTAVAA